LDRARDTALSAYAHQDIPFEKLVEHLNPTRDLSRTPLFDVMLSYEQADQGVELSGLDSCHIDTPRTSTAFDLTLHLHDGGGRLYGGVEYRTDLFDRSTIERFCGHLTNLLGTLAADPDQRVGDVPYLSEPEKEQLVRWAGGGSAGPVARLDERFREQARRAPDAVAVSMDGTTLTYRDLDRRANYLAHRLRQAGVGCGAVVGLCLERGIDTVVATLGVLKAGAAYLPLDPGYPAQRLAFMLAEAGAAVVVTQRAHADRLPADRRIVFIEDATGTEPAPPAGVRRAEDLAYVIFTSGSTGAPKGVMVSHANVSRLFTATADPYGFSADDVWAGTHSFAFDFSVWEMWGALLHGGRLVIVPAETARAPRSLLALLVGEGVTMLSQTPSAFRGLTDLILDREPLLDRLALRFVVFGGEALSPAALRSWFERMGDTAPRLVNMYGITETTVHVTAHPLTAADLDGPAVSPVGAGLADLRLHVLDAALRHVPIGVAGELYVGGAGVASGYAGRPDLTAERFVADPFAADGARLYRTGDLMRWRVDGNLDFLGRIDDQFQIRGYRVEPAEVEAALVDHPGVRAAAVGALPDPVGGGQRLAAWLVLSDLSPRISAVRDWLGSRLPEHLVPSRFAVVDELPVTSGGKLDRRAVLSQPAEPLAPATLFETPHTPTEKLIADVWRQVLGVADIGRRHHFFELGGHSLLATQVINRIRTASGFDVALRELFEHPVLSEFAAAVERSLPSVAIPAICPVDRSGRLPLSFAQQRLWLLHQLDPDGVEYTIPIAIRLTGALDQVALCRALTEVVSRHEVLRTTVGVVDGRPVQVVGDPAPVALPVVEV
ncbi:MAG TPA: amino acid adenylation domain-containing protein, partial [Planosporangium sp.]|nr:amino acid adenylation domain-containing protein [Planosporangium sp.]